MSEREQTETNAQNVIELQVDQTGIEPRLLVNGKELDRGRSVDLHVAVGEVTTITIELVTPNLDPSVFIGRFSPLETE